MARTSRKNKVDPRELTAHPFASVFPMLEDDELEKLREDVKKNGLVEPIVLFEGAVLDGRNRLAACLEAGVEPRFEQFKGSEIEALARIASANLSRRHIPAAQRAAIAAELLPMERALAEVERKEGKKPKNPAERAARKAGVSTRSVRAAEDVLDKAPDVFEALKGGEVRSLPEARALAALPEDERKEALEMPREERRLRLAETKDPVERVEDCIQKALGALDGLIALAAHLPHHKPAVRRDLRDALKDALDEARTRVGELSDELERAKESDAA